MDAQLFNRFALDAALALLPGRMDSLEARVMLLAIGHQESGFEYRAQIGGPARGFLQFEEGGGTRGVMTHSATQAHAKRLCHTLRYPFDVRTVYEALEDNDTLAAGFGRLLLWSDPHKLPAVGEEDDAWDLYIRTWRPGKPHHARWAGSYAEALRAVRSA